MKTPKIRITLAILLIAILAACSTSTVITEAQIVADTISVAAPVAAAFGGPGAALVSGYLVAAAGGVNCLIAAAEVSSSTTASVSAAAVTCFASAALPVLPSSVPSNVSSVVNAVASGISALIKQFGGTPKVSLASPQSVKLTYGDHRRLKHMRQQIDAAVVTLTKK